MKSYFEIGGHVVELEHGTSLPSPLSSPSSFRGAPTTKSEGATPRNKQVAGGRKGEQTNRPIPYTGIGNPVVWAGSHVLMKAANMLLPKDVRMVNGELVTVAD